MIFPNIDPIALQLGPLAIRWYSLAYVAGILLGYVAVNWLDRKQPQPLFIAKARDDLIFYGVLGVVLGGRLGYTLFYNLPYYLEHPLGILALWQGGMSFHGGLIGVMVAFYLFARKHQLNYFRVMDYMAVVAPIGLFFGRIANFINGELYGRVTDSPWGMVFPAGGPLPRYPSQLAEAIVEGFVLFIIVFTIARFARGLQYVGRLSGLFLSGYALARMSVECIREPDAQLGFLFAGATMGQLLCIPMLVYGLYLVVTSRRRPV
jgi:phosphatidylglycerol:prolipoprotein diacylglycerol transferase